MNSPEDYYKFDEQRAAKERKAATKRKAEHLLTLRYNGHNHSDEQTCTSSCPSFPKPQNEEPPPKKHKSS